MFVRRRAPFVSQPARPSSPGGACDDPIHPPLEGLALDLLARSVERVGHGVDVSRVQTLKDLPNAGLLDLIEGVRHQNQLHLGACEVPSRQSFFFFLEPSASVKKRKKLPLSLSSAVFSP